MGVYSNSVIDKNFFYSEPMRITEILVKYRRPGAVSETYGT
jgi:hypothetical protein